MTRLVDAYMSFEMTIEIGHPVPESNYLIQRGGPTWNTRRCLCPCGVILPAPFTFGPLLTEDVELLLG